MSIVYVHRRRYEFQNRGFAGVGSGKDAVSLIRNGLWDIVAEKFSTFGIKICAFYFILCQLETAN